MGRNVEGSVFSRKGKCQRIGLVGLEANREVKRRASPWLDDLCHITMSYTVYSTTDRCHCEK